MLGFQPLPRTLDAALRDAEHAGPDVRLASLGDLKRHARSGSDDAIRALVARLQLVSGNRKFAPTPRSRWPTSMRAQSWTYWWPPLGDQEPTVRQMALLGVGELAEPEHGEARAAATRGLVDPLPAVRYQAVVAWRRAAR